jgi:hypothetical protein
MTTVDILPDNVCMHLNMYCILAGSEKSTADYGDIGPSREVETVYMRIVHRNSNPNSYAIYHSEVRSCKAVSDVSL